MQPEGISHWEDTLPVEVTSNPVLLAQLTTARLELRVMIPSTTSPVHKAFDVMSAHFGEPLDYSTLAEKTGLSVTTIQHQSSISWRKNMQPSLEDRGLALYTIPWYKQVVLRERVKEGHWILLPNQQRLIDALPQEKLRGNIFADALHDLLSAQAQMDEESGMLSLRHLLTVSERDMLLTALSGASLAFRVQIFKSLQAKIIEAGYEESLQLKTVLQGKAKRVQLDEKSSTSRPQAV